MTGTDKLSRRRVRETAYRLCNRASSDASRPEESGVLGSGSAGLTSLCQVLVLKESYHRFASALKGGEGFEKALRRGRRQVQIEHSLDEHLGNYSVLGTDVPDS